MPNLPNHSTAQQRKQKQQQRRQRHRQRLTNSTPALKRHVLPSFAPPPQKSQHPTTPLQQPPTPTLHTQRHLIVTDSLQAPLRYPIPLQDKRAFRQSNPPFAIRAHSATDDGWTHSRRESGGGKVSPTPLRSLPFLGRPPSPSPSPSSSSSSSTSQAPTPHSSHTHVLSP